MDRRTIFTKTAKGLLEATGKTSELSRELRSILREVDGRAEVAQLSEKLGKMSEKKLLDGLADMKRDGYVREFVTSQSAPQSAKGASAQPPKSVASNGDEDLDFTSMMPKAGGSDAASGRQQADELTRQAAAARAREDAEVQAKIGAARRVKAEAVVKARLEAEAREKVQAAAKAKAQAVVKARLEAEAKAKADAEAKEKAEAADRARAEARQRDEAEAKARREAQERAQREAQERARVEAEFQARLDQERRAREESERQAREEAQRLAREEEERRRKEDEERKAREEEERKAAEERARREAEERRRKEAEERKAREEEERKAAEERARREAEERRRKEDEERKAREEEERKEAEERARREAEERRRKEDEERKAREEEERKEAEERARREAEERRRKEDEERKAREEEERKEAEERARREAEERRRKEDEERKAREEETERRERDSERESAPDAVPEVGTSAGEDSKSSGRTGTQAAAQARKEARARERALAREGKKAGIDALPPVGDIESDADLTVGELRPQRNWARIVSLGFFVILIAALAAIHVVPIDVAPYEKAAQQRLGEQVRIGSIRFWLLPRPNLYFEKIAIGSAGAERQLNIASLKAVPELGSMFAPRKVFRSVEMVGLTLPQAMIPGALWGKGSDDALSVERVIVKGLKLELKGMALPPLDLDASFGPAGLEKAQLVNVEKGLSVSLQRKGEGAQTQIEIQAKRLELPFAQSIALDEFSAKGVIGTEDLALREFEARAFDGILTGNARLSWRGTWSFAGAFAARGMDAAKLAAPILSGGSLEGKGVYGMKSDTPEKLMASARTEGSFSVKKGSVAGVDLTRTLQGTGGTGGSTLFSEMTGSFFADAKRIQMRQISLAAGLLSANGSAGVDAQQNLSGRLQIELRAQTTHARATLAISGTRTQPRFQRTN